MWRMTKGTYGSRGAYAPPLTPSVKGGVIGELRSPTPLTPPFKYGQGGIVRIPQESLQIFSSIKPTWI